MGGRVSTPPSNPSSTAAIKSSSKSRPIHDLLPQIKQTHGSPEEKIWLDIGLDDIGVGEEERKGAGTALWLAVTDTDFGDTLMDEIRKCGEELAEKGEEKDVAKQCINARAMMKRCIEVNPDHFEQLIRAERDALNEVLWEAEENRRRKKISHDKK